MTSVRISERTAILLRALLRNPDRKHWTDDLADETGIAVKTIRPMLNRLVQAGWMVTTKDARTGRAAARRYYRLSRTGRGLAESELKQWTFEDAN